VERSADEDADRVGPTEGPAKVVAFFSLGEDAYGEPHYDTQSLENVMKPECMLAYRMNGATLPSEHGAPLRLRVENQLGYKMVKWIERIEFIESEKRLARARVERTRTVNTSTCCRTSNRG
jgi:DMSO/TMAO reductase YedYZ molybdopterin-dependent catalytic subunit